MKIRHLALFLAVCVLAVMLSSCEAIKFANHMLNIFGPEDNNNVNVDLDIVIPNDNNNNDNTTHVHSWLTTPGKPATCKTEGYTESVACSECGEVRVESTKIPLAAHTYDDSVDNFCNVCGHERTCTHSLTEEVKGYPATIDSTGLTDGKRCQHCGEMIIMQATIPATGSRGLEYTLNNDKTAYIITGVGSCTDTTLYICGVYNDLPVIEIGSSAFANCSTLTSIVMSNNITKIGDYAFDSCNNLTSITIGNGVNSIGEWAFYKCSSITNLVIPDNVTSIGYAAFHTCESLANVTIGSSASTGSGTTIIGPAAFANCPGLTSVTIGNNVSSIGGDAFSSCSNLTSVAIGNNVKSINSKAFFKCIALTKVIIPDSVTKIGYEAFSGCSNLADLTIGNNVTDIGGFAFSDCNKLTSIVIPDSVQLISANAFDGCVNIESATIPAAAISCIPENNLKNITITSGKISANVFFECNSLQNVIIGDRVTSIGNQAFYKCGSLTSVTIGNGVTTIGQLAFDGCNSLASITFTGTTQQWNDIAKGDYWNADVPATEVVCSNGKVSL